MSNHRQLLDRVHGVAQVDALTVDGFMEAVRADVPATTTPEGYAAADETLRAVLAAVDLFAARAMSARLAEALAADTSLGAPFAKVIATTIVGYAGKLDVLRERVLSTATRVDPRGAAAIAERVIEQARLVLDQRDRLRAPVIALAQELAAAAQAPAKTDDDGPPPTRGELLELD